MAPRFAATQLGTSRVLELLLSLLTGADQGTEGESLKHNALPLHCLEHLQGQDLLSALLAGADQGAVK